uniref:Uncharacterized protein n=1 Tax=Rhizophora mucronata TaxID=61149 RepID=A0A2P2J3E4_RHIMU
MASSLFLDSRDIAGASSLVVLVSPAPVV